MKNTISIKLLHLGMISFLILAFFSNCKKEPSSPVHLHQLLAGEPTQTSVILQARLAASDSLIDLDIPGSPGYGQFQLAEDENFNTILTSEWIQAQPENDFVLKTTVKNLLAGQHYYYRLVYGHDSVKTQKSRVQPFKTLAPETATGPVRFVMVTGMNYTRFYAGQGSAQGVDAYEGEDAPLGFHAFDAIRKLNPDFFIGNGDNVYYDQPLPGVSKADSLDEMRACWHRLFAMPRLRDMLALVPTYWLKDDHDHRFDDSDTVAFNKLHGSLPSNELGIAVFKEQIPVVDPAKEDAVTYRTYRPNQLLQIWMVEGRDHRSPNTLPDGPDKSVWGETQKKWLKKTLQESDAVFKILVSPTPMVGPDDSYKSDNHTNQKGFRHEGDAFFAWLKENNFLEKNFYIICGDRHWQYHSIHPSGFEEFSCGALIDQNSRIGRSPGDPESTDPEGLIKQTYTQTERSGGFLQVNVQPGEEGQLPQIVFEFYDEYGELLYQLGKPAKNTEKS
jgi:alkaline phosphatase/alkaline phosphatase D